MERIHSLYLHVPFCTWVCKYCDFNAYAVLEGLIPRYVDALAREIELAGAELPIGPLDTVFIGGGTPSLLTTAQLRQLMAPVGSIGIAPGAEITLEANPSNVTSEHVAGWLEAGVNRSASVCRACSLMRCAFWNAFIPAPMRSRRFALRAPEGFRISTPTCSMGYRA